MESILNTKQSEEGNDSYSKACYRFIALVETGAQPGRNHHTVAAFTFSALSDFAGTTWPHSLSKAGPFAPTLLMSDNPNEIPETKQKVQTVGNNPNTPYY